MSLHNIIEMAAVSLNDEPSRERDHFLEGMVEPARQLILAYEPYFEREKTNVIIGAALSISALIDFVFSSNISIWSVLVFLIAWPTTMFVCYRMRNEANAADLATLREMAAFTRTTKYED